MITDNKIPRKANRVLNIILLGLLLILIRVWYLSVIQHEEYLQESRKPQRRTLIEHVDRATIRDRFNIPLAVNKIQYNAAVCYAQIRSIPSIQWKKNAHGKREKVFARASYIKELSQTLGKELQMDPSQIEDTIHGKASLFPHTAFVIKEDLSEREYYRLKMLEKDWLGIQTQKKSKRYYPQGKVAADIIGYMGAISQKEYICIADELLELNTFISQRELGELVVLPKGFQNPLEVKKRAHELQEKAYTIHDFIGKGGIESAFDQELRGYFGKKLYEVDVKGNFLRELPGSRKAVPGQRILLSISSELQEFSETLLAEHEKLRDPKDFDGDLDLSQRPWIKGSAIVAMQPQTGEILTLASYPRFDPNDFIPTHGPSSKNQKQSNVIQWLENEIYIGEIWDGKRPLEREIFSSREKRFYTETLALTWNRYLDIVLPPNNSIKNALYKIADINTACELQIALQTLLHLTTAKDARHLIGALYCEQGHTPSIFPIDITHKKALLDELRAKQSEIAPYKKTLDTYLFSIPHNDDKILAIDLIRILAPCEDFSEELKHRIGQDSLENFRELSQSVSAVQSQIKTQIQRLYHENHFKEWRENHFKEFLKEKRKEEKQLKRYARPYTEYLDQIEKKMFREFWETYKIAFLDAFILGKLRVLLPDSHALFPYLTHLIQLRLECYSESASLNHLQKILLSMPPHLAASYLKTMRCFSELTRPLLGRYRSLRNQKGVQLEKHLAGAFYPLTGFGYGRSQAFRQSTPQGSVFKIITAYQALVERYEQIKRQTARLDDFNPLTLVDISSSHLAGYTLEGHPIPRIYKGGRLPRSSHPNIGKVDLLGAIEQSSNVYFAILAAEHIHHPENLCIASRHFGFGERTGIELPGEISGKVPNDISFNKTGLYSFSIGQHSLVVTPLQTASMLSAIANGGTLIKPKIVQVIAGKEPSRENHSAFDADIFPYKETLSLVGISFPLFSETKPVSELSKISYAFPEMKRSIHLPETIRHYLLEGMHRVITGSKGTARPNVIRSLYENPQAIKDYIDLQNQIVGKTGTAEILYKHTIDTESKAQMHKHIWFAGISFSPTEEKDPWSKPELVVIVYLRFGGGGKDAAPIAAQIIKKWREICTKHGRSAYVLPSTY